MSVFAATTEPRPKVEMLMDKQRRTHLGLLDGRRVEAGNQKVPQEPPRRRPVTEEIQAGQPSFYLNLSSCQEKNVPLPASRNGRGAGVWRCGGPHREHGLLSDEVTAP